jgi:PIN domain nuclease of toxin-antitoxin system
LDLLADTNVLVWTMEGNPRLGRGQPLVLDPENRVWVSTASIWELAIKVGLGKVHVRRQLASWLPETLRAFSFLSLPVEASHALAVERLPRHHGDPFDRLLIAQATIERLTIITGDAKFEMYGVPIVRC